MSENKSCLNCHYFSIPWDQRWCNHPLHYDQLKDPRGCCKDHIGMFEKGKRDRPVKIPIKITVAIIKEISGEL